MALTVEIRNAIKREIWISDFSGSIVGSRFKAHQWTSWTSSFSPCSTLQNPFPTTHCELSGFLALPWLLWQRFGSWRCNRDSQTMSTQRSFYNEYSHYVYAHIFKYLSIYSHYIRCIQLFVCSPLHVYVTNMLHIIFVWYTYFCSWLPSWRMSLVLV